MSVVEICVCGHQMSRHELVGTEYVRCQKHPWKCYCSGESRAVLLVTEEIEKPSGSQTVGKYFRKTHGNGRHPFNAGLARIIELGIEYEWIVDDCERCGLPRDGAFTAVNVGMSSEKNELICEICVFEAEEVERRGR